MQLPDTLDLPDLVQRAHGGDERAAEALFRWVGPMAQRAASRYRRRLGQLLCEEIAEHAEEGFFKAVKFGTIRATTNAEITAYLVISVRHRALDIIKKTRPYTGIPDNHPDPRPRPDTEPEQRQQLERTERILESWSPKDRYLFLAKAKKVPAADIVKRMKELFGEIILPATVDSRYSKLRTRLKNALGPE